jgi:lantibiotic transport system permease protein
MFIKSIRAEQIKLRRSPMWLAFFILPILPAIMGTFNYIQNIEILDEEWYSLWTQHTLFTCYFFLPAIIGVYCSYLFHLEHTKHNWNAMMTAPIPAPYIYLAKLVIASFMVFLTQFWIGVLFVISGKLAGLTSPIPAELPMWLLIGAIGGMVICSLQLCISLVIRSFAVPVGLAFIGGIAGLAVMAKGYGIWFPYSLMSMAMHANNTSKAMIYDTTHLLINCFLFLIIFFVFAMIWLKLRDVKTV